MANSLSFNGVDLSAYGLVVTNKNLPIKKISDYAQLMDRSYSFDSKPPPKPISLNVSVRATSKAILEGYLDSIGLVLNEISDQQLILDSLSDRYFNARVENFEGAFEGPMLWRGIADFICYDPFGYDIVETSSDHTIDADPKTITETPGGTAVINPVWTWTPQDTYAGITIHNTTTDEEITWTGAINAAQVLEIDTVLWIVKLDGVESMTISGRFPRLLPNIANSIEISDAWGAGDPAGNLNIKYRDRYV